MPPAQVEALVCPRCGAPLPVDLVATPQCAYCGVGILVRGAAIEVTQAGSGARLEVDSTAFFLDVKGAIERGVPPTDAIRQAAPAHLGVLGQNDAVGRVTLAIAHDFDRQNPAAKIERDGMPLCRIAEGYLKALPSLRDAGEAKLSLPYLAVAQDAPVHLEMTLTPATIATMLARASRDATKATEPSSHAPDGAESAKKRGW